jgi:hypothetical protein
MTRFKTFSEWLIDNPPPDLQALAEHYRGLGNVPEAVMRTFEAEREQWERRRKFRHLEDGSVANHGRKQRR